MRCATFFVVLIALSVAFCGSQSPLQLASAVCPSNGNTHAVYVTSNLGDNIWSFDTQGSYLGEVLNRYSFPPDTQFEKLRAMRYGPEGHLYISSARGSTSTIFAVSGNGLLNGTMHTNCTRDYLFTVTKQDAANPFFDHPYDMAFHPETDALFVGNQNSMTITKYVRKSSSSAASQGFPQWVPAPNMPPALPSSASATTDDNNGEPIKIPENAGLFASPWAPDYFMSSVRGVTISPKLPRALIDGTAPPGMISSETEPMAYYLLSCDIATSTVHVFDPDSGVWLFGISVPSPVQVTFPERYYHTDAGNSSTAGRPQRYEIPYIYVTSKEDGLVYLLRFARGGGPTPNAQRGAFQESSHAVYRRMYTITDPIPLHAASGLYENPSRQVLMVADRNGRSIRQYASPFLKEHVESNGPTAFLGFFVRHLPDQPEFIMSVLLENQYNIPFCYELGPSGNLRYVALCSAAYIWSVVLAIAVVIASGLIVHRFWQRFLSSSPSVEYTKSSSFDAAGESVPLMGDGNRNYGTSH